MKKFIVDDGVWKILPDMNIGVLILENVDENIKMNDEQSKEIEEFIYTHPKVKDVQVIGVPDAQYGEDHVQFAPDAQLLGQQD